MLLSSRLVHSTSALHATVNTTELRQSDRSSAAVQVPTEPTKLFVITTAAISAVTGASTPASVLHLSLADNHIKRLECLSLLTALRSLTVAHNELLKLDGLSALTALESLDVSHNRLNRIEGLAGLNALTFLDLSHNELNRVDDISLLRCAAGSAPCCWLHVPRCLHALILSFMQETHVPAEDAGHAHEPHAAWQDLPGPCNAPPAKSDPPGRPTNFAARPALRQHDGRHHHSQPHI